MPRYWPHPGAGRGQDIGRVDVSEPASISSGIAKRYATAVFDLSKDANSLAGLESDINTLSAALDDSDDLRDLMSSPLYSRTQQSDAVVAVARKMGLSDTMTNTLALMASKRRLFAVPQMLTALRDMIATEKGEVTAEVVSAKSLTKEQSDKLAQTLKASVGSDVNINATVDESLIGGLVVKVGSKMIDTSVKSKLNALQNTMKEAR
ncbi:F0F1 ATP synthase subunit delta [Thalassorhabdomicrobium marinisediminis]|uniref:ATP synthase subunit delta n=1 Tax=Thalassorhabdomicrobium marinisediminis TaxID=2170577 RepID=A0A2T7FUR6_9RHOB|nr:F0F1 ATP synthase subunit delta [Thalassorhabdomicrobium marinisediminis]PVA05907.1 F0F1 ATP synthase subunit delta [Thalassorhabdomicrobium marinisediminis]